MAFACANIYIVMTVKDAVLEKLDHLSIPQQREVLHFVEFLETKVQPKRRRRSLAGALSHLNFTISEDDIREARNEMWRGYTKDTQDFDRTKKYE